MKPQRASIWRWAAWAAAFGALMAAYRVSQIPNLDTTIRITAMLVQMAIQAIGFALFGAIAAGLRNYFVK